MLSHPGRTMSIYEIAGCLVYAFFLAFTPRNIESSFKVFGIWPVNSEIFTEDDYLSTYVTDRGNEDIAQEIKTPSDHQAISPPSTPENTITLELELQIRTQQLAQFSNDRNIQSVFQPDFNQPSTSATARQSVLQLNLNQPSTSTAASQSVFQPNCTQPSILSAILTTPEMIRPYPKFAPPQINDRGRKRAHTKVFTESPEKEAIKVEYMANEEKKDKSGAYWSGKQSECCHGLWAYPLLNLFSQRRFPCLTKKSWNENRRHPVPGNRLMKGGDSFLRGGIN